MKIIGITAEYNPFHNGHAYQIRKAKQLTGADYVIAVMSPDFVQRGSIAIADKWTRARMALLGGADLVLELPVCWAVSSAEYFAQGAVALLSSLNVVGEMAFGVETGDIEALQEASEFFSLLKDREPLPYRILLRDFLKKGLSYPKAREAAYHAYRRAYPQNPFSQNHRGESGPEGESESRLSGPNNILAVEYLKALRRQKSSMTPLPIRRIGEGYHPEDACRDGSSARGTSPMEKAAPAEKLLSAESVRNAALQGRLDEVKDALPEHSFRILRALEAENGLLYDRDLDLLLHMKLTELCREKSVQKPVPEKNVEERLACYMDVNEDLAGRIRNHLDEYESFDQFTSLVKSRQLTYTRVHRALLHILLDIRTEEINRFRENSPAPYARILGFRRDARPLLHLIRQRSEIPLIPNLPDALKSSASLPDNSGRLAGLKAVKPVLSADAQKMLLQTVYSSKIYSIVLQQKTGIRQMSEYRRKPVIL